MERSDGRTALGLTLMIGGAFTAVASYMNRGHDLSSDPIYQWRPPLVLAGPARLAAYSPRELRARRERLREMTDTQQSVFLSAIAASITGSLLATVWSETPVYASVGLEGATAGARLSW